MNVYEYQNEKGEVRPVSTAKPSVLLEGVIVALRRHRGPRFIERWNELREEIKKDHGNPLVCELDASGYVTEWLNQKIETK